MKPLNDSPIVVVGGGTGLANLLGYLIEFFLRITVIVTMFDNGSFGGVLPVGDARKQFIVFIPKTYAFLKKLVGFRFGPGDLIPGQGPLAHRTVGDLLVHAACHIEGSESAAKKQIEEFFGAGNGDAPMLKKLLGIRLGDAGMMIGIHSLDRVVLGNVILTALAHAALGGSLPKAFEIMHRLCRIPPYRRVMPATLDQATLVVRLVNGEVIRGQKEIDQQAGRGERAIKQIWLDPMPKAYLPAQMAIFGAEGLIVSAGTYFTSVLPSFLIDGIRDVTRETTASFVLVTNILTDKTQPGWTGGQTIDHFSRMVMRHPGAALCNDPNKLTRQQWLRILEKGEDLEQEWEIVQLGETKMPTMVIPGQFVEISGAKGDSKKYIGHWREAARIIAERIIV